MHVFPSSTPLLFYPFHVKCFPPLGRLLKLVLDLWVFPPPRGWGLLEGRPRLPGGSRAGTWQRQQGVEATQTGGEPSCWLRGVGLGPDHLSLLHLNLPHTLERGGSTSQAAGGFNGPHLGCRLPSVAGACLFPLSLHPPTAAAPKRFQAE